MKTMKLASAGEEVKIWEAPSYFLVNQYNPYQSTSVRSVAWSPDGQQIASVPNAGEKVLLTLVKHSALHNIEVSPGDVVTYAVFNNLSSRFLGFGCKSGNIIVWDLKSQKARRSYLGHRDEITCLHFNWNDSYVASGSVTGDILLHNVTTGHTSAPLRNAKAQAIRGLEYGFIKKSLLGSVSDDGSVSLWDVNSRQLMHGFTAAHSAPATGLVFSPVNNILLISVGLDKKIISYDVQMKNHVKSFSCDAPLTAVDFMDDGVTLAVGTSRGKVHIYDLRLSSTPVKTLAAHNISVHSLAFQNTSNRILSQGESSKKKSQHNLEPAQNRDFENGDLIRSNAVVTYSGISTAASAQPSSISSPSHSMPAVYVDTVCPGRSVCDVFSPVRDGIYKTFDRQNSPITYGEQRDSGSFSQTVFSPLQESTMNSNVRRQPIGGGSQNSSHLLGDRPVTTGLAESDEEKNNSVAPITLPEMPVSVNSFYYATISEESNCSQKPASASPTKNSAEKVISQTSTEAPAKCTSLLDDVLENDKFGQNHRTEPCGGSSSAGLDTITSSNHLDSPSTMDRPDVMGATGEEGAGDISSDKWKITDVKESSINGWQDDGDTKEQEPKSQSLLSKRITCRKPWSIITSGNQEPQAWDKCLESQVVEESRRLASPQAFQAEFVHQVVRDAMEEFRDSVHRDLFNLHVEVIRQFHNQMAEIHNLVRQYSVNDELLAELERLREENKQLKATF
ncbi:protein NEDD1-like isoform X2 [Tachypleus tridentatus]